MTMFNTQPVLFIGHGSPMNAITDNAFTQSLENLGLRLKPKAILCVSAHWLTSGTWVTSMSSPKTIHDFYGFPDQLFRVQYPAAGAPEIAEIIHQLKSIPRIQLDNQSWGFDHGAWAILRKMYPKADVPVLQLSIDMSLPIQSHFDLGRQLQTLRDHGVLIIGSGNIVHNLGKMDWSYEGKGFDWAIEFDQWVQDKLENRDFKSLVDDFLKTDIGRLSVPTLDHYLPLLYVIGAVREQDQLATEFTGFDLGSISMRCFSFG